MDNAYLDLLNETFSDPSKLSLDGLKVFINETVKFFAEIKGRLASGDAAIKEDALNASMEVKKVLETKMDALCKLTGLDPSQLSVMSENPDNMNPEEYDLVQGAKSQFSSFVDEGRGIAKKSPKIRNLQG